MTTRHRQTRLIPEGDTLRPGERSIPGTNTTISSSSTGSSVSSSHLPSGGLSLLAHSDRLGPRDYTLALLLDEHRVFTARQITTILFGSPYTCRNRLTVLRHLGFVDRFIPYQPGQAAPVHWVAGPLAARYAALRCEQRPPSPKTLRERQDAIVSTPQLAHLVGANQFFTDLLAHARVHPDARLLRWWPASRAATAFGRRVRPDAYAAWTDQHRAGKHKQVSFFLEHDNNTETLGRLVAKLDAYRRLRAEGGPADPVLFWLPSAAREANLHQRLVGVPLGGVTVATAARDRVTQAGLGPADAVWRIAGNGRHRLPLADLPSAPGPSAGLNPPPPMPEDDPLYLLRS
jgi:hypothetical protein